MTLPYDPTAMRSRASTARVLEIFLADPTQEYHGYVIGQRLEAFGIPMRTAHSVLRRLAKQGWFEVRTESVDNRLRVLYRLTPKGLASARWLVQEVHEREHELAQILTVLLGYPMTGVEHGDICRFTGLNTTLVSSHLHDLHRAGWTSTHAHRHHYLQAEYLRAAQALIAMVLSRRSQ